MMAGGSGFARNGFTLVEMLVALAIFAVLVAAGVGILRASVDSKAAVARRLTDLGEFTRLEALLSADLNQAVVRSTRSGEDLRPAFAGDGASMRFVRGGWTNLDGDARSDLQRAEWRVEGGSLVRIGHARLDGEEDGGGRRAELVRNVETATFRYRRRDGSWTSAFLSAPEETLPSAVELTVARRGEAPITFVIALALDGPFDPARPRAPEAS